MRRIRKGARDGQGAGSEMAQLSHLETKAGSHLVSDLFKDQVSLAEAGAMWNLSGWDGKEDEGLG